MSSQHIPHKIFRDALGVAEKLEPLKTKKDPVVAAIAAFALGGVGLGAYLQSWVDFFIPWLILLILMIGGIVFGDPIPLSAVVRHVVSTPVTTQTTDFSPAELTHLAQNQLFFATILVLLLVISFVPLPADFDGIAHSVGVVLSFMSLGFGWRLARSLKRRVWVWVLLLLCPVLSWFFAACLVWLAFKTLKENKALVNRVSN